MFDFTVYRSGANVALRCSCGWHSTCGNSISLSELQSTAVNHLRAEHTPSEQLATTPARRP